MPANLSEGARVVQTKPSKKGKIKSQNEDEGRENSESQGSTRQQGQAPHEAHRLGPILVERFRSSGHASCVRKSERENGDGRTKRTAGVWFHVRDMTWLMSQPLEKNVLMESSAVFRASACCARYSRSRTSTFSRSCEDPLPKPNHFQLEILAQKVPVEDLTANQTFRRSDAAQNWIGSNSFASLLQTARGRLRAQDRSLLLRTASSLRVGSGLEMRTRSPN